jgi:hypothetical protein
MNQRPEGNGLGNKGCQIHHQADLLAHFDHNKWCNQTKEAADKALASLKLAVNRY